MIHDPDLLDKLAKFETESFGGRVFRATRMNLDPTAYSTWGGRWAPKDDIPVLYTSLEANGAIAEISHHWMLLTPRPKRPVMLHGLDVTATQTLKLIRADLKTLSVDLDHFGDLNYTFTQQIGAAVAFLGNDGLIVPSARWDCENLILFDDGTLKTKLTPVGDPEQVDWQTWCKRNGRWTPQGASEEDE
ncbi:MAG: RES family NAD+ phosphorylase [Rhodanobacteraceae bacterium]